MVKSLAALVFVVGLSACTHNPVPKDYTGPLAAVQDSATVHGSTKADFFVVSHVNGQKIGDSIGATVERNYGQGMAMRPAVIGRAVPAEAAIFTIKGRTHYAAPILSMVQEVYEVQGDVAFTPVASRNYQVKGQLTPEYSAVWIEDSETQEVVAEKIEVKGSAKLGFFQK